MIVQPDEAPDVLAIVTTLGGNVDRLKRCVSSVCASSFEGRIAVVVVWNDSRNPRVDVGDAVIVEPGLNIGYPAALNFARKSASTPLLWIIQDDMTVTANCLQILMNRSVEPDAPAIVSPIVITTDGLVQSNRGGVIASDITMKSWYPSAGIASSEVDVEVRLDWVSLSGALVRTDVWDAVGGMDPTFYPLLWSDVDFGYRVTQSGRKVVLEPAAHISHERNGSTPPLLVQFLYERNAARLSQKYLETAATAPVSVDAALLEVVAREAGFFTLDFSQHVERELLAVRRQLSELESGMAEREDVLQELHSAGVVREEHIQVLRDEVEALKQHNQQLMNSRSMQFTKPFRSLGSLVRKYRSN